jgi:hypothetical protein
MGRRAWLGLALAVALGCGDDGSNASDTGVATSAGPTSAADDDAGPTSTTATPTTGDSAATDGSASADGSSGDATTNDPGTTGGGSGGAPLPYCHEDCSATGVCMLAQVCEAGQCEIGCNDDGDCVPGNACHDFGGGSQCAVACNAPADCALPGGAAWDEDNWACDGGACNYLGCTSDDECAPSMVCRDHPGVLELLLGYDAPSCVPACTSAADCDLGAEPTTADNYACEDGGCRWIGCLDDAECPGTQICG